MEQLDTMTIVVLRQLMDLRILSKIGEFMSAIYLTKLNGLN